METTRNGCLNSFNDQNCRLFPTYLDQLHLAEGSSSISGNTPILGASAISSYFGHSSAFQPLFNPPFPYTWQMLGRYGAVRDGCSAWPDKKRRSQFTDSPATSHGSFERESFSYRTQTSTALEDAQSVIEAGISDERNSKSAGRRLSSSNSECSSAENRDSDSKNGCKPRRSKKPVEVKDDRYWKRREKNNLAAKKSRDARRRQELSTQQRATFLEIENTRLQLELSCLRQENRKLKRFLDICEAE